MPKSKIIDVYPHIAQEVFGKPLMISKVKLDVILSVLENRASSKFEETENEEQEKKNRKQYEVTKDGIALIDISGTLVRKTSGMSAMSGLTSYRDLEKEVADAASNKDVKGILLSIDSPGGDASGLTDLMSSLRVTGKEKPIWAMADDSAFSAAYGIASCAEKIWLSSTGGVGSVGVIAVHLDRSKANDSDGFNYTVFRGGKYKAEHNSIEPLTEHASNSLQMEIDRLYKIFSSEVAESRGMSVEQVMATEGQIYYGENAVKVGFADYVGTAEQAYVAFVERLNSSDGSMQKATLDNDFNSVEFVEYNGETYHRIRETSYGIFSPNDTERSDNSDFNVTMIEQGWSLNNRYYTEEAIDDFVEMGNQQVVSFFNHGETFNRDPRDWGAMVTDATREGKRARAKLHIFDEPDGPFLRERIKKAPGLFGLSVDAFAKIENGEAEGRKGTIVTEILRYNSLDVVMFPGARGAFDNKESISQSTEISQGDAEKMTLEELKEKHPDTYKLLEQSVRASVEAEVEPKLAEVEARGIEAETKVKELEETNASLSAKVNEFEEKQAQAEFEAKLVEHVNTNLPENARRPNKEGKVEFVEICKKLGPEKWDLIEAMTQERRESFEQPVVTGEGERKVVTEKATDVKETVDPLVDAATVWSAAKAS